MILGIDHFLSEKQLHNQLLGKRVALAAHPASVTARLEHSLDALVACENVDVVAAFGPQHGMRGEKQDNMIESADYNDPRHNIPVFSLYGVTRRPTAQMMEHFDVLLFDIQDLGCRIYTYITTLLYLMEACAEHGKGIWILDRPNPVGRPVEGLILEPGWESFVGAGRMAMRHGLTIGEMARWFKQYFELDVDLQIVEMKDYDPEQAPGYGWPIGEFSWVNPSPNAANLNMARAYAGTVLLEGTTLSEGRGTTRSLEVVGAPDININHVLRRMDEMAPEWMQGAHIRPCYFEPTFHKHSGQLCQGYQVHTDNGKYNHYTFKPFRLMILTLKAIRQLYPEYELWSKPPYEYEEEKIPIDVISGNHVLREWVDDREALVHDMEFALNNDELEWKELSRDCLIY